MGGDGTEKIFIEFMTLNRKVKARARKNGSTGPKNLTIHDVICERRLHYMGLNRANAAGSDERAGALLRDRAHR